MSGPAEALVTGASSGLGRRLARRLGEQGRRVLLLARDEGRLGSVREEVEEAGGRAEVLSLDVRERAALVEALSGRDLDLVLHAAGVLELGPVDGLDESTWRRLLEVNVLGAVNVVAAALPSLARRQGRVGVLASLVATLPVPGGFSAYSASKWALRGWAETVRPELAARGVSLTVAYPAVVDTPMVAGLRESGPAVYRAFPWHEAGEVARRFLRDTERRKWESWAGGLDRAAALAYRLAPRSFAAAFRLLTRWRAG